MEKLIKDILEEKNIPLTKFAIDFAMSRNTANQYIDLFDSGQKIPKEKYNYAFDKLFSNYDSESFEMDYYYLARLIKRDKLNGTFELSMKKTDDIMNLFRKLNIATQTDSIDSSVLYFIDIIIGNYSKDGFIKSLCNYFYFFNNSSLEEYSKLSDEEKIIYTNYFKVFTMQKQGLLKLDEDIEKLFLSRMEEINKLKSISETK